MNFIPLSSSSKSYHDFGFLQEFHDIVHQFVEIGLRRTFPADNHNVDRLVRKLRNKGLETCAQRTLHAVSYNRIANLLTNREPHAKRRQAIVAIIQYQPRRRKRFSSTKYASKIAIVLQSVRTLQTITAFARF